MCQYCGLLLEAYDHAGCLLAAQDNRPNKPMSSAELEYVISRFKPHKVQVMNRLPKRIEGLGFINRAKTYESRAWQLEYLYLQYGKSDNLVNIAVNN